MRSLLPAVPVAAVLVLLAGCGGSDAPEPAAVPTHVTVLSPSAAAPSPKASPKNSPAAAQWPAPADCVSYDPATLKVHYEAGVHAVSAGTTAVLRLQGGPGEPIGAQGLALAQRYRRHCYLGRGNTREEKNTFVFDYWRDPTGAEPPIAGEDDNCSSYDRANLTVEDMGSGDGWRVKDHDHVLHVFDDESDARAGRLVLAKYSRICFLGGFDGDDAEVVTYFP